MNAKVRGLGLFNKFSRKSLSDLSEWNKNDEKLLQYIEESHLPQVQNLVEKKKVCPTKLDPQGHSALHVAAMRNKYDVVQMLIAFGANVMSADFQGRTALHCAARHGASEVIQLLIECTENRWPLDDTKMTALHHACIGGNVDCVFSLMRKFPADIESFDSDGRSPLFYAAQIGHSQVCQDLLARGANLNISDKFGRTPLMCAAENGNEAICELFMKKGANTELMDRLGHTAIWHAMDAGHTHVKNILSGEDNSEFTDMQEKTNLNQNYSFIERGHSPIIEETDSVMGDDMSYNSSHVSIEELDTASFSNTSILHNSNTVCQLNDDSDNESLTLSDCGDDKDGQFSLSELSYTMSNLKEEENVAMPANKHLPNNQSTNAHLPNNQANNNLLNSQPNNHYSNQTVDDNSNQLVTQDKETENLIFHKQTKEPERPPRSKHGSPVKTKTPLVESPGKTNRSLVGSPAKTNSSVAESPAKTNSSEAGLPAKTTSLMVGSPAKTNASLVGSSGTKKSKIDPIDINRLKIELANLKKDEIIERRNSASEIKDLTLHPEISSKVDAASRIRVKQSRKPGSPVPQTKASLKSDTVPYSLAKLFINIQPEPQCKEITHDEVTISSANESPDDSSPEKLKIRCASNPTSPTKDPACQADGPLNTSLESLVDEAFEATEQIDLFVRLSELESLSDDKTKRIEELELELSSLRLSVTAQTCHQSDEKSDDDSWSDSPVDDIDDIVFATQSEKPVAMVSGQPRKLSMKESTLEIAELRRKNTLLEQENSQLKNSITEIQAKYNELSTEHTDILTQTGVAEKKLELKQQELTAAADEAAHARMQSQRYKDKNLTLTENVHTYKREVERLRKKIELYHREYTKFKDRLKKKDNNEKKMLKDRQVMMRKTDEAIRRMREAEQFISVEKSELIQENVDLLEKCEELAEEICKLRELRINDREDMETVTDDKNYKEELLQLKDQECESLIKQITLFQQGALTPQIQHSIQEGKNSIKSLQLQVKRLQSQLSIYQETAFKYEETIEVYRDNLILASQNSLDPDIKQALQHIIELRQT